MFEKFTSLFEKTEAKEDNEFDATQLAVASLMITTAKHDGIFDEIEKEEILKLLNNYYKLTDESLTNLDLLGFLVTTIGVYIATRD